MNAVYNTSASTRVNDWNEARDVVDELVPTLPADIQVAVESARAVSRRLLDACCGAADVLPLRDGYAEACGANHDGDVMLAAALVSHAAGGLTAAGLLDAIEASHRAHERGLRRLA